MSRGVARPRLRLAAGLLLGLAVLTAVHNHGLDDQPRIFSMHFWANDDPAKLARGLRAALDQNTTAAGVQVGAAPAQVPRP